MDFKNYNIANSEQLMKFLESNMNYGFIDGDKAYLENPDFGKQMAQYYQLKTGEDLVKAGYGVCWDFCEFEREFCEQMKIPHECYFLLPFFNSNEGGPTHTFLLLEQDKKWCWFEYAWQTHRGIWEYPTKEAALKDIMAKFCQTNERPYAKVDVYKTAKAKPGLNFFEFIDHCLNGQKIAINHLENDAEKADTGLLER